MCRVTDLGRDGEDLHAGDPEEREDEEHDRQLQRSRFTRTAPERQPLYAFSRFTLSGVARRAQALVGGAALCEPRKAANAKSRRPARRAPGRRLRHAATRAVRSDESAARGATAHAVVSTAVVTTSSCARPAAPLS